MQSEKLGLCVGEPGLPDELQLGATNVVTHSLLTSRIPPPFSHLLSLLDLLDSNRLDVGAIESRRKERVCCVVAFGSLSSVTQQGTNRFRPLHRSLHFYDSFWLTPEKLFVLTDLHHVYHSIFACSTCFHFH